MTVMEYDYILGHSDAEIRRLQTQAAILRPITERLLRCAGIQPGMRVLDLVPGPADVAMLAGELVGPSGWGVGIVGNPQVLSIATQRARSCGLQHLAFREASPDVFMDAVGFDLVVGRYVLVHQTDPVAFLRVAAQLANPGGTIAFHELRLRDACHSVPQ